MHPVLEQIKQFLAPRWYKLQKSVVEFVKQFLVPKLRELQKYMVKFAQQFLVPRWHELQKYMVEFKERMTMKRMVVMCLLLVAVVCGSLALVRGDGKQDWEKEPYPFEIENIENGFRYKTNLPVKASDNKKGRFNLERIIIGGQDIPEISKGLQVMLGLQFPLQVNDVLKPLQSTIGYLRFDFSNGQNLFLQWFSMKNSDENAALWMVTLHDLASYLPSVNTAMAAMDEKQQQVYIVSMLRSYDIKSIANLALSDSKDDFVEIRKINFEDLHSAATINAMLDDAEKRFGYYEVFGKVLTKGSPSSNLSEKSVSSVSDDDEELVDLDVLEKQIVINSVETQHNVIQNGQKGMNIVVDFSVDGMKNKMGWMSTCFYFEDGTPLKDGNKSTMPRYGLDNGNVGIEKHFTPSYDCSDLEGSFFMPYDELHLRAGKFSLKFNCVVFDDEMNQQDTSDWQYFTFTW